MSLLGGILNSLHKFWVNAAAPILLNLCMIGAMLFFNGPADADTARAMAFGVTLSGVLQLLWLIVACRAAGVKLKLRRPRLNADVKQLLKLIWPAALGAGAMQVNLLISTMLAARFLPTGSVTYIDNADRLNQLPLGLVGIGLGTVLLPTIARLISSGDERGAIDFQKKGLQLALFLSLPATAALIVAAQPIIRALLEYGAFDAYDTAATAGALAAFAVGLPAYILIKVLTPGFHARQDMKTPLRFALVAIAINLVGNLILIWPLAHVGPPLATAIAAWVNVLLLYRSLTGRGHFEVDRSLVSHVVRLVLAAVLMGASLLFINRMIAPLLAEGFELRVIGLALLVGGGVLVYAAAVFITRAYTLAELRAVLRRKPKGQNS